MTIRTSRKPGELVFNGFFVLVSLFLVYQSFQISGLGEFSSPGFFPLVASFAMLMSSLFTLFSTLREVGPSRPYESFFGLILPRNVVIMLTSVLLFLLCMNLVGFVIAALMFLFITFSVFYRRGWQISALLAVVSLAVVYFVFRVVFLVVLPEGEWLDSLSVFGV